MMQTPTSPTTNRHPTFCSIIPPHILDRLSQSDDAKVRRIAIEVIKQTSSARAVGRAMTMMAGFAAVPSGSKAGSHLVLCMPIFHLSLERPL